MFSSSLLAGVPNPRIWNRCATLNGQGCHQCVSWPRWITGCNQNIFCTIAIHLEKKQVWGPDSAVEWVQCEWEITKTVTFSICETSFRESVTLACFRCPASVSFKSQFCTWQAVVTFMMLALIFLLPLCSSIQVQTARISDVQSKPITGDLFTIIH